MNRSLYRISQVDFCGNKLSEIFHLKKKRFCSAFDQHVFFFIRGTQTINLEVTEGGPLPFAFDILTTAFEYGNRAFTKYPPNIPDFFKESFPEGYSWERTMDFADGGVCDVTNDITLVIIKMLF